MKLSLQLKLGQQLTMTPQLQQAIKLLQLSTLDLQQEIHQALESNPMLELIEGGDDDDAATNSSTTPKDAKDAQKDAEFEKLKSDANEISQVQADNSSDDNSWQDDIPGDLSVDSNWDDIYPSNYSSGSSFDGDSIDFESRNTADETLQDHLYWQLNLTPMSEQDEAIAMAIIDAIDANGMLTSDIESIHGSFDPESDIELDEVLAVLHRIQQ
ncbi:MAG: RNA polymerase factor sigma-54, partial [Pseudohongiellaceae bacterium]